ncbi:hypothetical protein FVE85_3410 [Porphyridium purpureum]|uniref:RWP-RK domain-containing protein n=1 Tax=Porphyridium purpureum TaxID=35688 RepID=A0A5J4YUJ0_PORPP|nr:hypothetical protein FVE85_3410 [Porphyridium purpureum]|eukprot:POR9010..scf227_4
MVNGPHVCVHNNTCAQATSGDVLAQVLTDGTRRSPVQTGMLNASPPNGMRESSEGASPQPRRQHEPTQSVFLAQQREKMLLRDADNPMRRSQGAINQLNLVDWLTDTLAGPAYESADAKTDTIASARSILSIFHTEYNLYASHANDRMGFGNSRQPLSGPRDPRHAVVPSRNSSTSLDALSDSFLKSAAMDMASGGSYEPLNRTESAARPDGGGSGGESVPSSGLSLSAATSSGDSVPYFTENSAGAAASPGPSMAPAPKAEQLALVADCRGNGISGASGCNTSQHQNTSAMVSLFLNPATRIDPSVRIIIWTSDGVVFTEAHSANCNLFQARLTLNALQGTVQIFLLGSAADWSSVPMFLAMSYATFGDILSTSSLHPQRQKNAGEAVLLASIDVNDLQTAVVQIQQQQRTSAVAAVAAAAAAGAESASQIVAREKPATGTGKHAKTRTSAERAGLPKKSIGADARQKTGTATPTAATISAESTHAPKLAVNQSSAKAPVRARAAPLASARTQQVQTFSTMTPTWVAQGPPLIQNTASRLSSDKPQQRQPQRQQQLRRDLSHAQQRESLQSCASRESDTHVCAPSGRRADSDENKSAVGKLSPEHCPACDATARDSLQALPANPRHFPALRRTVDEPSPKDDAVQEGQSLESKSHDHHELLLSFPPVDENDVEEEDDYSFNLRRKSGLPAVANPKESQVQSRRAGKWSQKLAAQQASSQSSFRSRRRQQWRAVSDENELSDEEAYELPELGTAGVSADTSGDWLLADSHNEYGCESEMSGSIARLFRIGIPLGNFDDETDWNDDDDNDGFECGSFRIRRSTLGRPGPEQGPVVHSLTREKEAIHDSRRPAQRALADGSSVGTSLPSHSGELSPWLLVHSFTSSQRTAESQQHPDYLSDSQIGRIGAETLSRLQLRFAAVGDKKRKCIEFMDQVDLLGLVMYSRSFLSSALDIPTRLMKKLFLSCGFKSWPYRKLNVLRDRLREAERKAQDPATTPIVCEQIIALSAAYRSTVREAMVPVSHSQVP